VGRHAASGSDGIDWSDAPVATGRRRTDGPDGLWSGAPSVGLSDQQTDIGRVRGERRRDSILDAALEPGRRPGARPAAGPSAAGTRAPDGARQISRSRLPLPPVPAGPRTTAAPFQAVPSPEIAVPAPAPESLPPAAAPAAPAGAPLDRRRAGASASPVRSRPDRSWRTEDAVPPSAGPDRSWRTDDAVPPSAGPDRSWRTDDVVPPSAGPARGARASAPSSRMLGHATPSGTPSPAYGDWTKPSHQELAEMAAADEAGFLSGSAALRPAPATTAIPERSIPARRERVAADEIAADDDAFDHYADDHEVAPVAAVPLTDAGFRGPGTGSAPVTGVGRAARRAELQAAELARREAAKRNGIPIVEALADERPRRGPHRVTMGLVAMVVVALGVLGVYQVTSPNAEEAGSEAKAATTSAPALADAPALPTLPPAPVVEEAPVVADVKAPVTVLNATQISGLAAKVAASIAAGGWKTPAVGAYLNTDVAASTVFFTEGNETQRQAAVKLVDQFPQLTGPAPRFFEVPADTAAPGLVVVTTGDWKP
jgi:LytR cell envelope-related transcriptional attenuator